MSAPFPSLAPVRTLGRYALFDAIASGGMATVHLARLNGAVGFARIVAIKRLHPHLARDVDLHKMFVDEARLAARIKHPNVVPILDVLDEHGEIFLVMEYVAGEALSRLWSQPSGRDVYRRGAHQHDPVPPTIASAIVCGVLHGLHSAHEAMNERGEPLGLVHRDVSPQNILVGGDGVARVIDFGVAKAIGRLRTTRDGSVKGKIAYMAPEQLRGAKASRQSDIYAAAVVLWELLTGRRLFAGSDEEEIVEQVLIGLVDPPSKYTPEISAELDALLLRGLDPSPDRRFASAREMALALEACLPPSFPSDVAAWVEAKAGDVLAKRAQLVAAVEAPEVEATSVAPDAPTLEGARPGPRVPARSRRWARGAVAIAGVTLAVALAVTIARSERPDSEPTSPPTPTGSPSALTLADPEAAPTTPAPPSPPSSGVPSVVSPKRGPARSRASVPPSTLRDRGTSTTDECRVPYEVDATGRKIYKRNCL